ncbi:hypothetical protein ARNL5_02201 [Anaerolineae bacterium]|nr:hypothetical protein ARNL5_02201 [Anaerolineae bacterium]
MKFLLLFITLFCHAVYADDKPITQSIWSIENTAKQNRWLIIHNLNDANNTGIYHIEVIGKNKKDPAWKIQHLANHIAITKSALLASIIKPLSKGDVYPESFNNAFSIWQKENEGKGGAVCNTTVIDCMK